MDDGPLLSAHPADGRHAPRELDDARRARPGDDPPPARGDGQRDALPAPGGDRQHGGDGRPHLQRPIRARPGRRMVRTGVERVRHPARFAEGPLRPSRRGRPGHPLAARQRAHHVLGPLLRADRRAVRTEAGAGPPPDRDRRQGQASHAANRRPARRSVGRDVPARRRVLARPRRDPADVLRRAGTRPVGDHALDPPAVVGRRRSAAAGRRRAAVLRGRRRPRDLLDARAVRGAPGRSTRRRVRELS